ncbi:MAG: hypothetical protein ACJ71I_15595, partial [Nitrososphaeraceae archaeon]
KHEHKALLRRVQRRTYAYKLSIQPFATNDLFCLIIEISNLMPLVGVDYFGHILIWRAGYNGSPKIYASVFFDYFREVRWLFRRKTIFKFSAYFKIQGEHLGRIIIQNAILTTYPRWC